MKTTLEMEMIDEETVSINIKIIVSAQWFLIKAGGIYQHFVGRPLDMDVKRIEKSNED